LSYRTSSVFKESGIDIEKEADKLIKAVSSFGEEDLYFRGMDDTKFLNDKKDKFMEEYLSLGPETAFKNFKKGIKLHTKVKGASVGGSRSIITSNVLDRKLGTIFNKMQKSHDKAIDKNLGYVVQSDLVLSGGKGSSLEENMKSLNDLTWDAQTVIKDKDGKTLDKEEGDVLNLSFSNDGLLSFRLTGDLKSEKTTDDEGNPTYIKGKRNAGQRVTVESDNVNNIFRSAAEDYFRNSKSSRYSKETQEDYLGKHKQVEVNIRYPREMERADNAKHDDEITFKQPGTDYGLRFKKIKKHGVNEWILRDHTGKVHRYKNMGDAAQEVYDQYKLSENYKDVK